MGARVGGVPIKKLLEACGEDTANPSQYGIGIVSASIAEIVRSVRGGLLGWGGGFCALDLLVAEVVGGGNGVVASVDAEFAEHAFDVAVDGGR